MPTPYGPNAGDAVNPNPPDEQTRARMSLQKRAGTAPEIAVRRLAHRRGLRYRVDAALPIPGIRRRADLLFPGAGIAVFVDGCYWHSCPLHATAPKNNREWWRTKLAANVARDRDTDRRLAEIGWLSLRAWEHEEPEIVVARIEAAIAARRAR